MSEPDADVDSGERGWCFSLDADAANVPAAAFLRSVPWLQTPLDPERCAASEYLAAL